MYKRQVVNAYVQPLAQRYLLALEHQLQALGYPRDLYLMLSSGAPPLAVSRSVITSSPRCRCA